MQASFRIAGEIQRTMDDDHLLGLFTSENLSEFIMLRQMSVAHERLTESRG
jgi:hypothetical protein